MLKKLAKKANPVKRKARAKPAEESPELQYQTCACGATLTYGVRSQGVTDWVRKHKDCAS